MKKRIIDANINRAIEGVRVVEDIVRFYDLSEEIYNSLRTLRHNIGKLRYSINGIKFRDSIDDMGKDSLPSDKDNVREIMYSNISRAKESLRVIEELGDKDISKTAQELRFSLYNIEGEIYKKIKIYNIKGIYPIVTEPKIGYKECVKELVNAGSKVIQLRIKEGYSDIEFFRIAFSLRDIIPEDVLYIINDRIDIALAVLADGVHVGQDDMPVNTVRDISSPFFVVGKSTHNIDQVKNAMEEKPDYIGVGPVFPTKSKKNSDPVLGIDKAKEMVELSSVPTVCIGGINSDSLKEAKDIKCSAFAVMSYITSSENPGKRFEELMNILKGV